MRHIRRFSDISELDGSLLERSAVISVNGTHATFVPINGYTEDEEVTLSNDTTNIGVNYLKCTITASADTTLPVYYTVDSYNNNTPDETLTLTTGDNEFYFNKTIYKLGIYVLKHGTMTTYYANTNITGVILDGTIIRLKALFNNGRTTDIIPIKNVDLTKLNVSKCNNLHIMFQNDTIIESVGDLSNWDVSNVTNMKNMFYTCSYNLTYIGKLNFWDVSLVTDMDNMFAGCFSITTLGDLNDWDVSLVTTMESMFHYCASLTNIGDLSNWNVSKVTNMSGMFEATYCLTNIGDISNWDVSLVTTMDDMFLGSNIEELDLSKWDTSNVTTMIDMFLDIDDGINDYHYNMIKKLGVPPVPKGLTFTCTGYYLEEITACGKISGNCNFWHADNVSRTDLLKVINALDSENPYTLKLGTTAYSKLTESDIKIATDKGWTVIQVQVTEEE